VADVEDPPRGFSSRRRHGGDNDRLERVVVAVRRYRS
jgi:hypothetical protein